jgi:succinoglycan biosynthesis transport protein ExoP
MSQDNRLMPLPGVDRSLDRPLTDLSAAKSYGPAANEPTQLRDYLFVVLKRKWLIISLCLVVTSLVAVQMFRQPSIYQAESTVRIEQRQKSVLKTTEFVVNAQPDANFWGTQIKLLQSPNLARQVALTLDLQHNPTFFGGGGQSQGVFSSLRKMFGGGEKQKSKASPAAPTELNVVGAEQLRDQPLSPEELSALEPYEDMIMGNEQVDGIVGTNLFTIKYRHTDPEMAQRIANTLADVFATNNLERSTDSSNRAAVTLAKEIAELQTKIRHDTETLFSYQREHNLPPESAGPLDVEGQRLASLSKELLEAQNERNTAEAIYKTASASEDKYSIPEVQANARITSLRDRISTLKEKKAALEVTYTKEWPEVKKIDVALKPLETELDRMVTETIGGLKTKYDSALAHENSIRTMYNSQKGTTSQQTRDQIEVAAQKQTIETNQQYLNTLLNRSRDVQALNNDHANEVNVETYSRLGVPIGPARMRNIMIAFLLSLVAGIGLAFLLDFLDDTVKSVDDIDRYIHLPALAMIPASNGARRLKGLGAGPPPNPSETTALAMIDDARSPVAESYRHLRTSLLLSSAGQPPKTILVTSSQPSEGKTTTAINTAFMLSQTGAEVLIIDCDLRRPRLHAQFEVSNARGLTTWLSGEKDLDGIIQPCPRTRNLKILTSGPVPPNPAELLGSPQMRKLLEQLSERYQHIIIDSPPAISFTDASILSTMVDGVMLVVHGGRSSRAVVRRAKQQLLDVGAHIFGVVLNNVRLETQDYYYSSYYSNYYSDADNASAGEQA